MRRTSRNRCCRFGHGAVMILQTPARPHVRNRTDRLAGSAPAGVMERNAGLAEIPFGPMNHSMTSRRSMPGRSGRRLQQQRYNSVRTSESVAPPDQPQSLADVSLMMTPSRADDGGIAGRIRFVPGMSTVTASGEVSME